VDDFENPAHVEAGEGGDFYGLDPHRMQIVRVSPRARHLKTYSLPDGLPQEKRKRNYSDFRVCENTKAFYLVPHPDPVARIVCVGFDGKDRWAYEGRIHYGPVAVHRWIGAFDVDANGVLHVLDGQVVKKIGPDGKPAGEIKLEMGDAVPIQGGPSYGYLRVHDDEVLLRRGDDSELFRCYDLKTGKLKQVVRTDHERLTVTFDGGTWTAGRPVPIQIKLTAGEHTQHPRWRIWARPFASLDYREFSLKDGAIQVPTDAS